MFIKKALATTAAACLLTGTAFAGDGPKNASIGYLAIDGDDVTLGSLVARWGVDFSPNFGIEGEASYGIVDDDVDVLGTDVEVSAEFGFGGYLIGRLPMGQNGSDIFGRVGYQTVSIEAETAGVSGDDDLDGFAFGVGTNIMFDEANGLRLDFTRFEGDDAEADTFAIAYVRRY
jgi:hypothetical protein